MGFDTTIIINNDMLSEIESDTNFGKMVAEAIKSLPGSDGPVPIGNGSYVIESHHMDAITVVAVGGRRGQILGSCPYTKDQLEILRYLALKHNLTLVDNEHLNDLNKKPSLAELREWADSKGYRLVKTSESDTPESAAEEQAIDRLIETSTYSGPDRRKASVAPALIPIDDKHIGELSEELLRKKPKQMTLKEMNEFVKKTYGCRMISLVRKSAQVSKKKHG